MEELAKKVEAILDLAKAMMASIKQTPVPGVKPPSVPKMANTGKIAGFVPQSQKNPVKVAEQTSKPVQKIAVKEAKSQVKTLPNGQWTMK